MRRVEVSGSSMAKSVGFDISTGILEVEKLNGDLMRFSGVDEFDFLELLRSDSFGRGMQKFLRTKNDDGTVKYPCAIADAPQATRPSATNELSSEVIK